MDAGVKDPGTDVCWDKIQSETLKMPRMSTGLLVLCAAAAVFSSLVTALDAQGPAPLKRRVTFDKGATSATIKGQIKGDQIVDYAIRAAAGQTLSVNMTPSNRSAYFNVLPPGSSDVAMFNGQNGDAYTGILPADGDYSIRVYLVRAAARRNEASDFTLTVRVTGKSLAPLPASQDARVKGTPYHATAEITCLPMPYGDPKPITCQVGVIRRGIDGTATVEVKSGQLQRRLLFVAGKVAATDSMDTFEVTRKGDVTTVKFSSGEFYEIPDALVSGG